MRTKKSKLISLVFSFALIIFSIVTITVFLVNDYTAYYKTSLIWKILLIVLLFSHVAVTFASKSVLATVMMIVALPSHLVILPMSYGWKYFVILLFATVFLISKKLAIKIIGSVICVVIALCLFTISGITDDNSWNPDIQTVFEQSLITDDGSKIAELTVYRTTRTAYQEEGYAVGVYFKELGVIDMGSICFARGYKESTINKEYSQYPVLDAKWIDNDTFEFAGKRYNIVQ